MVGIGFDNRAAKRDMASPRDYRLYHLYRRIDRKPPRRNGRGCYDHESYLDVRGGRVGYIIRPYGAGKNRPLFRFTYRPISYFWPRTSGRRYIGTPTNILPLESNYRDSCRRQCFPVALVKETSTALVDR